MLEEGARSGALLARASAPIPANSSPQYPVSCRRSARNGTAALSPAAVVLRVFASAEGASYRVLPGGLAREPSDDTCLRSLNRLNGILKDVWVLTEDSADVQLPPARRFHQLAVERRRRRPESRVADNLYWLGRYIERLDGDAPPAAHHRRPRSPRAPSGRATRSSCACSAACSSHANLMDQTAALSAPENAAFQQG